MKIQDAKPGDVLRDRSGSLWLVEPAAWLVDGVAAARIAELRSPSVGGGSYAVGPTRIPVARAEEHGPFVRLVSEKETP